MFEKFIKAFNKHLLKKRYRNGPEIHEKSLGIFSIRGSEKSNQSSHSVGW